MSTLKVWRQVVAMTFIAKCTNLHSINYLNFLRTSLREISRFLVSHFEIRSSDFEYELIHIADVLLWGNIAYNRDRPARFLEDKIATAMSTGRPWQVLNQNHASWWNLTLAPGVTVTFTKKMVRHDGLCPAIVCELSFIDAAAGQQCYEQMTKASDGSRFCETEVYASRYDGVLWIRGRDRDDWVFTRGSRECLGERVVHASDPWNAVPYRIAPLTGEELVVYSNAPGMVGLPIKYDAKTELYHHDRRVFASVGPYSLTLLTDTGSHRGPNRDKIAVFYDSTLPIKPTDNELDEEEYDDDPDYDDLPNRWVDEDEY